MNSVEVTNLTKIFKTQVSNNITALDNVSLSIGEGIIFGLLGPNGAGKSTLMNCIIGYLNPDKGKILLKGDDTSELNLKYRLHIGYVPQEIALYQELTAIQNLKIFGSFYDLPAKVLNERISSALHLVKLEDRKSDLVKNFSGGMKRRLNIAVSILHNPEIILCDEPTVGVDPQSRNAIFDMLKELNKQGKTILYTTHYMEEAERLCNKLAIIDNGKIIAEGTLSELIALLEKRETIKIRKAPASEKMIESLKKIGEVTETDFHYEIIPNNSNSKNSELFNELEKLQLPSHLLELSSASLEDVFLMLTGRSLRD
ncbi:MAG: ABC transporter ATP-binding protein [Ignavibacteriae bacterium]|nr:ABC transporter ATP-binding protein [Ignavibacteriota bacterium]MCB9209082.1 ABC transporter ATP-binding protein [Ignavibacteriales bacterium]MCB9217997.1 ABC transporter ATP-binding protein [Ignavibacteriales bacterium]MCB9260386.1 ABC transporter ATP-binding protein [Ignavibacteriales bacterium]